jgi:protein-S-isoprenylcysteine O-methyltransferase Ste14
MIPQSIAAILLAIPLSTLVMQSISYWTEFGRSEKRAESPAKAGYKKPYFYALVFGVLCMWLAWLGGMTLLLLHKFDSVFGFRISHSHSAAWIQVVGFIIFYLGAAIYNLTLFVAGKYLRPAPSGIHEEHKLILEGPYRVIRHPLYVSYILISLGLSLALHLYWLLIPTACILLGIYPTARAEEEVLVERFGEEYRRYKRRVGMLFPKLF